VRTSTGILRTYAWIALFLALRAGGNLFLAWGTKRFPQTLGTNPLTYLRAFADPLVALGVGLLIFALLARLALLSVADLSFVLPTTAVGYLLAALLGKVFLHEAVSGRRWAAVALIFAGAALVGSTPHSTTSEIAESADSELEVEVSK
jgi:drug/metabolite transporter (DMT)-like permease